MNKNNPKVFIADLGSLYHRIQSTNESEFFFALVAEYGKLINDYRQLKALISNNSKKIHLSLNSGYASLGLTSFEKAIYRIFSITLSKNELMHNDYLILDTDVFNEYRRELSQVWILNYEPNELDLLNVYDYKDYIKTVHSYLIPRIKEYLIYAQSTANTVLSKSELLKRIRSLKKSTKLGGKQLELVQFLYKNGPTKTESLVNNKISTSNNSLSKLKTEVNKVLAIEKLKIDSIKVSYDSYEYKLAPLLSKN